MSDVEDIDLAGVPDPPVEKRFNWSTKNLQLSMRLINIIEQALIIQGLFYASNVLSEVFLASSWVNWSVL